MTRGGAFYAIYDEETGFWTKSKPRAIELIDQQVREFTYKDSGEEAMNDQVHGPCIMTMADSANHLVEQFDRFCKTMGDNWHALDQRMLFSNSEIKRTDYASKTLDYPLVEQPTPYYDTLCEVLYLPDEREKWEWAVGSMITGDSTKIQKMFAFYGEPGTGKSTIISKIFADQVFGGIEMGYAVKFEANNLVGGNDFGTDFLENDSVLVYDDDAEMGMITVRSTLNKIISHEQIRVNAKFKSPFMTKANCMIFVGSNDPIQLNPNSGMKRRLIDIRPTGNLLTADAYDDCMEHIPFEKSGIAWRCLQTYKKLGRHYYDHYIAEDMMARTSPFHNFVIENVMELKDGISLAKAYDTYLRYAEMCKFKNELVRYKFRDTLKLYFDKYEDTKFSGFRWDKIGKEKPVEIKIDIPSWLNFDYTRSDFDVAYDNQPAQYANEEGLPKFKWEKVKTVLGDLDTSKLHYVKMPEDIICIDFDIKDEDGNKSLEKNIEAASKFPPTYAELSKSGCGIHLHYIYTGGDPKELSRIYDNNVEIKVFTGNAALRRQLTYCNDIPIAEISSGLPLKEVKGGKKMVDWDGFMNEKILRSMIIKNLKKEYHSATKPSVDYIDKLLSDAYASGVTYDVRDMQNDVLAFAMNSTHQADYCVNLVANMLFCSKDILEKEKDDEDVGIEEVNENAPIVIYDVEIAPSYDQYIDYITKNDLPLNPDIPKDTPAHFLVCWKFLGEDKSVQKMLDPKPNDIPKLFKYNLVGHNVRNYDNHMTWAKSQGYTEKELYSLNDRIINEKDRKAKFGQAYNLSYADTLNFASAANKMGLKKWEILLGDKHLEWDRPWYEPIPDSRLVEWVEYCSNDVISTEHVWYALQDDFEAIEILAKLSGGIPNDTVNSLTIKLLTHDIPDPQSQYVYTDLSTIFPGYEFHPEGIPRERYSTEPGAKVPTRGRKGKSIYMGEDPSEGGFANCPQPGVYFNVGLFDVASMHPHSAIKLGVFGKVITKRYENLVEARVAIKHIKEIGDEAYNNALKRVDAIKEGSSEIIKDILAGLSGDPLKRKCKAIANALKTAINSVYGLTSAKFDNKLRDPRNVDNIVAKYGALFMITLKHKLQDMGYTVVHIKTDSIKVANYDEKVKKFIFDFGKKYGFTFEHEATYSKMCIVDDAQYIAYEVEADGEKLEEPYWTATGAKFGGPMDKSGRKPMGAKYLFKSLFSHEQLTFEDFPETKSVDDAAIYLVYSNGAESFIGRVGSFVCVKEEYGGSLMRVKGNTRATVTGTKGYFWAEAESVKDHPERLNLDYYRAQCDAVIDDINELYPFDEFVDCDPTDFMFIPEGSPEEVEFNAMNPPEG